MLELSEYRDAIKLDEPFIAPERDPRSTLTLLEFALTHLGASEESEAAHEHIPTLLSTLHRTLMARDPRAPMAKDVEDAISVILYRQSARLGRTTGAHLMRIHEMWPTSDYSSARNVALWRGDVRELVADAVVNAALPDLQGCDDPNHPCIDNYIQGQAGPWLRRDCAIIHDLQGSNETVGGAKITRGYRLPAKYVLHTVSPRVEGGNVLEEDRVALDNCYTSCLDLAAKMDDVHTVAFCALSTGRNGFPFEEASKIALTSVDRWLRANGTDAIRLVIFNIFDDHDAERYTRVISNWVDE